MRVIAGIFGGRPIPLPKGLPVRPTTDRTREALFNILSNTFTWEGLQVLDLFSGTGSISLECWSRGAARVVSVDRNPRCIQAQRQLYRSFGIGAAELVRMDAFSFVRRCTDSFDLIFLDPPYDLPGQAQLIQEIIDRGLLSVKGLIVLEHRRQSDYAHIPAFSFRRDYGSSSLSFFCDPESRAQPEDPSS
jgi:16S rRNA (guanine(966)-N(2))-methyltransferase RsmD